MNTTRPKRCSVCRGEPFKFRGDRWLCEVHYRLDCMRAGASLKKKLVPPMVNLEVLAMELIRAGMTCPWCSVGMQWCGKRGDANTVSLQHDRCGTIRLLCMGCNNRHGKFPGDEFYKYPLGWLYCHRCATAKPPDEFYKNRAGSCCKPCRKLLNREMWAKFGSQWSDNSRKRKHESA